MSDRFFLGTNIFVCALPEKPSSEQDRAAELQDRAIGSGKGVKYYQVV
jgi:hypothetical protein